MSLNRKYPPVNQQRSEVDFLKVESSNLSSGIPIHIMNYGEQELMRIQFVFPAGKAYEEKPLLASAVSQLMIEGTDKLKAEEIATRIENTGAFVDSDLDNDNAWINLYCLAGDEYYQNVEELLFLIKEVLFKANFPEEEFRTYKKNKFQEFQVNSQKVNFLASNNFLPFLLGSKHACAHQLKSENFQQLDKQDVLSFYRRYYRKENMEIYISGKIPQSILSLVKSSFETLQDCEIEEANSLELKVNGEVDREKLIFIEHAVQSAIRIGRISISKSHPDYISLYVANTILGGYFGSRLMTNIRENKGYTYGVSSALVSSKHLNYFIIATEVGVQYTERCIEEIRKEIERMANELVAIEELQLVKNYIKGRILNSFDGAFSAMDRFKSVNSIGLDCSFYDQFIKGIQLITPTEIMAVSQKYLDWNLMKIVIVGKNNL